MSPLALAPHPDPVQLPHQRRSLLQALRNRQLPSLQQNLDGPFLTDSMAVYQVSFTGAPAGQYAYTCQPHEALGMNAALTIQK